MNSMGAGFVLKAFDRATPVLRRVGKGFGWLRGQARRMAGGMNAALGSTATGFMALHAGLGMIKLAKTAADAAGKFSQNVAAVGKVARATAPELELLREKAISAALGTQFSPDETIEGLKTLSAMGLKATQSVEVLLPVLDLATGSLGQLGVAGSADAVVGTIKAMNYQMSEATNVTNKLLKITQMTNFQTKDFSVSMGRVASSAKLYDQTLEDGLITMGLLRNMNIDASVASTGLREAWSRLAANQRSQQIIQEQGIDIFDKETKEIRPMIEVMSDLAEKFKDTDDATRFMTTTLGFGKRGMQAFAAVAGATYTVMKDGVEIPLEGMNAINAMRYELSAAGDVLTDTQEASLKAALGVEKLSKVLSTSTGVAEDFKNALLETYEGQKQLVSGAWQTLMVVIGEDFAAAMKPAAKALYEMISAVALFIKSMSPQAKAAIFKFVIALGALITVGGGLMLLSGAFSMLGGSLIGFVFSVGKLLVIGVPLVMLLSGLGIGFTSVFKAMGMVGKEGLNLTEILAKVRLAVSGAFSVLTGEEFSKDLQKNLKKAENQGVVKFLKKFERWVERFKSFWAGLKAGFEAGVAALSRSSAFNQFKAKLEGIIKIFTGPDAENSPEILKQWAERGEAAGVKLARLGESAADMMGKLIEFGSAFAGWISEISADDVKSAIDSFVEGFRTIGDVFAGIGVTLSMIYNTVKLIVSAIIEGLSFVGTGLASGMDTLYARIFGSDEDLARTQAYYDKLLDTDNAFSWTKGAAGAMQDTNAGWQSRLAENARRDREASAAERGRQIGKNLGNRKVQLEQWINASPEEWKKMTKGTSAEGNVAFANASTEMQQKFIKELESVNANIKKLVGKKSDIYLDGAKVGEQVTKSPAMTGEDSLDDVGGVALGL